MTLNPIAIDGCTAIPDNAVRSPPSQQQLCYLFSFIPVIRLTVTVHLFNSGMSVTILIYLDLGARYVFERTSCGRVLGRIQRISSPPP